MDMGFLERDSYRGSTEIVTYWTKMCDQRSSMASHLIERWGMVAAIPDGEDSAGRQKLRLLAPEELIERACAVAELTWRTFGERGWLMEIPAPKPIRDK